MATTPSMTIGKWKQMIWNGKYVKHLYCAPREGNKLWYCQRCGRFLFLNHVFDELLVKDRNEVTSGSPLQVSLCDYCTSLWNPLTGKFTELSEEEKLWLFLDQDL